jgi:hypothetical protein
MGDDITIGVTEIVNNIEVTAQPNDQIVDISVTDNADNVTLNITPTVVEVNINKGGSFAKWGDLYGTLSDQTDLQNALNLKANLVGGKVPASELPSYVDDIIEVANYAALPATGEIGKIYVTLDNNKIYRWSGSVYIEIASNSAIWGAITGTLSSQTDLQNALNAKQNTITLTTTGTSGSATLVGSTLNIPNYTTDISGLVPYTGATANVDLGTHKLNASDLVINHASGSGVAASITKGGSGEALTVLKTSGSGNAASILGGITLLDELHLNTDLADSYIASAATWNAKQSALTFSSPLVNTSGTISIPAASGLVNGYLSSTDWTTFNSKQNALTNPVTGTGTTNYLPKFTGSTALGNSLIYDSGTNVGIGTASPSSILHIVKGGGAKINFGDSKNTVAIGSVEETIDSAIGFFTQTTTERMRIFSSGNVFIGSSPTDAGYKLDVNGTGRFSGNLQIDTGELNVPKTFQFLANSTTGGSYGNLKWYNIQWDGNTRGEIVVESDGALANGRMVFKTGSSGANATERMRIFSSGNVFIGSSPTDAGYKLDVNGNVRATGFFNSSDNRLKDLIDYDYNVSDIKPITYLWKDGRDNKKHVGYCAQEVQKVMPDAVNEDEKGFLSVNYIEVLVAKISQMEKEIAYLKSKI